MEQKVSQRNDTKMTNSLLDFKFANWNANGLSRHKREFEAFLKSYDIDIACVTETHLDFTDSLSFQGYYIHRNDNEKGFKKCGGVAIFIKEHIIHSVVNPSTSEHETVGVKLSIGNANLFVYSCYIRPNGFNNDDFTSIFENDEFIILLGDLNAKHQDWACVNTNNQGTKLRRYAQMFDVHIRAPEAITHNAPAFNHADDILDIALLKNISSRLNQTVVEFPGLISDHIPVVCCFVNDN